MWVGVMPTISPAKIRHKYIFMMIPLVIGFQICPFLKYDIVLVRPAMNNIGISAYSTTKPILYIKPSRCIHVLCTQNRSYPTLIVRYNANKVPIIKKEPIILLCILDTIFKVHLFHIYTSSVQDILFKNWRKSS